MPFFSSRLTNERLMIGARALAVLALVAISFVFVPISFSFAMASAPKEAAGKQAWGRQKSNRLRWYDLGGGWWREAQRQYDWSIRKWVWRTRDIPPPPEWTDATGPALFWAENTGAGQNNYQAWQEEDPPGDDEGAEGEGEEEMATRIRKKASRILRGVWWGEEYDEDEEDPPGDDEDPPGDDEDPPGEDEDPPRPPRPPLLGPAPPTPRVVEQFRQLRSAAPRLQAKRGASRCEEIYPRAKRSRPPRGEEDEEPRTITATEDDDVDEDAEKDEEPSEELSEGEGIKWQWGTWHWPDAWRREGLFDPPVRRKQVPICGACLEPCLPDEWVKVPMCSALRDRCEEDKAPPGSTSWGRVHRECALPQFFMYEHGTSSKARLKLRKNVLEQMIVMLEKSAELGPASKQSNCFAWKPNAQS